MNYTEITKAELVVGGNVVRQGDHFTQGYIPRDYNNDKVNLAGKTIAAAIYSKKGIHYEGPATFNATTGVLNFTVNENIGSGTMWVEFTATDPNNASYRQKFPANEFDTKIEVVRGIDDLDFFGASPTTVNKLRGEQQALQQAYEVEVDGKIETFIIESDELKAEFNAAMGALTQDSEVVAARVGYNSLGEKLDDFNTQLADKATLEALEYKDVKNQRDFVEEFRKMSSFKNAMSLEKITAAVDRLKVNIPLSETEGVCYFFQQNANDHFMMLLNGDYGTLVRTLALAEKHNFTNANLGDVLATDHNTNPPNYWTTKIGAFFEHNKLFGTEIRFVHYADNRGGIWEFTLNAGTLLEQKKTISTFSSTAVASKEQVVFSGLELRNHKIRAEFKGADPNNAPSGTARGWLYYGGERTQDTARTFQVYRERFSVQSVTPALYSYSNKESPVRMRPNGSTEPYRYFPEHETIGTAFNKEARKVLVDGKEIDVSNLEYVDGFETLQIIQRLHGIHPSQPSTPLIENFNQETIKGGVVTITGKIKFLVDVDVASVSSMLVPYYANFVKKIKSSTGNVYDVTTDGTYTIDYWPESDKFRSLAFLNDVPGDAANDVVLAMTVDNLDLAYRYGEEGRGEPFSWVEKRSDAMGKTYNRPMKDVVIPAGTEYVYGGEIIVTKIPGVLDYIL